MTEVCLTQPRAWGQCWSIDCTEGATAWVRRDGVAIASVCPKHARELLAVWRGVQPSERLYEIGAIP